MFLESNTGNSCQVCSLQIRNLLHKMFQSSASPSLELGKKEVMMIFLVASVTENLFLLEYERGLPGCFLNCIKREKHPQYFRF